MTLPTVIHVNLSWEHRRGGRAHCLARLINHNHDQSVVILSELATNPRGRGIAGDVASAAEAFLNHLRQIGTSLVPDSVIWVLHHGQFSSPDSFGAPETFTQVSPIWSDGRYVDDLANHRLLSEEEVERLLVGVTLAPVEQPSWTPASGEN